MGKRLVEPESDVEMRTKDIKPIHILSLLKFIDIEYITYEDLDYICNMNINEELHQLQAIRYAVVPGYNELNENDTSAF